MKLWDSVCETDPKYTKKANVRGNKITAIDPQYQIMKATREFGVYGITWGFKEIEFDYSILNIGLIIFKAVFFFPSGSFPITNSTSLYLDNAKTKIDQDFAKKIETDTLTKALSKLGFNADIFLGKHDNSMYVSKLKDKYDSIQKQNNLNKIPDSKIEDVVNWLISKNKKIEDLKTHYLLDDEIITKLNDALDERA